jgi:hypothetical protein
MSTVDRSDVAAATRTRTFSWQDPAASAAEGLKLAGLDSPSRLEGSVVQMKDLPTGLIDRDSE